LRRETPALVCQGGSHAAGAESLPARPDVAEWRGCDWLAVACAAEGIALESNVDARLDAEEPEQKP